MARLDVLDFSHPDSSARIPLFHIGDSTVKYFLDFTVDITRYASGIIRMRKNYNALLKFNFSSVCPLN